MAPPCRLVGSRCMLGPIRGAFARHTSPCRSTMAQFVLWRRGALLLSLVASARAGSTYSAQSQVVYFQLISSGTSSGSCRADGTPDEGVYDFRSEDNAGCMQACAADPTCVGYESDTPSHCEVHTAQLSHAASSTAACHVKYYAAPGDCRESDGGSGVLLVPRYTATLEACVTACTAAPTCVGVEYTPSESEECEQHTAQLGYGTGVSGRTCYFRASLLPSSLRPTVAFFDTGANCAAHGCAALTESECSAAAVAPWIDYGASTSGLTMALQTPPRFKPPDCYFMAKPRALATPSATASATAARRAPLHPRRTASATGAISTAKMAVVGGPPLATTAPSEEDGSCLQAALHQAPSREACSHSSKRAPPTPAQSRPLRRVDPSGTTAPTRTSTSTSTRMTAARTTEAWRRPRRRAARTRHAGASLWKMMATTPRVWEQPRCRTRRPARPRGSGPWGWRPPRHRRPALHHHRRQSSPFPPAPVAPTTAASISTRASVKPPERRAH